MKMQRRYSKREVLGQLRVESLFSIHDLPGVDATSSRWEALAAFQKAGEARVERLIETDGGLIFLSSIPNRPNTGAIYVYHEAARLFFWMRFDRDDDLNGSDFDHAVWAYKLLKWTNLQACAETHGSSAGKQPEERGRHSDRIHLVS